MGEGRTTPAIDASIVRMSGARGRGDFGRGEFGGYWGEEDEPALRADTGGESGEVAVVRDEAGEESAGDVLGGASRNIALPMIMVDLCLSLSRVPRESRMVDITGKNCDALEAEDMRAGL